MVCRSVKKVHDQIAASPYPKMPLIWSEFNAAYDNTTAVTDTAYMGPYLANTIRECDGLTEYMSYWTFSDVFEEQGVVKTPFYGGFGLLAERDIPKPAFNDFALLHKLGDTRLDAASDSILVTKKKDGGLVVAAWNLSLPEEPGAPKSVTLKFKGMTTGSAKVTIVDQDHGSPLPTFEKLGSPKSPTVEQIAQMRKAAAMPPSKTMPLKNGSLSLTLQPKALALIELESVPDTAHELRHVCASLLIASGASDMQVTTQMGHSRIETTKNIYGHLFAQDRAEILRAMNAAVSRLYVQEEGGPESEAT